LSIAIPSETMACWSRPLGSWVRTDIRHCSVAHSDSIIVEMYKSRDLKIANANSKSHIQDACILFLMTMANIEGNSDNRGIGSREV
jgi:hypothetical protein